MFVNIERYSILTVFYVLFTLCARAHACTHAERERERERDYLVSIC